MYIYNNEYNMQRNHAGFQFYTSVIMLKLDHDHKNLFNYEIQSRN